MFCSKCGKEIAEDASTCPECEMSVNGSEAASETNSSPGKNTKENKILDTNQKLTSLNAEEIILNEKNSNIKNNKNNIKKMCKAANKKLRRAKAFRIKWNFLTAFLIIMILNCGLAVSKWISIAAYADYNEQRWALEQERIQKLAPASEELAQKSRELAELESQKQESERLALESQQLAELESQKQESEKLVAEFINNEKRARKALVDSTIVSDSNRPSLNKYINSLYRHSDKQLELCSYNGKAYYRLTNAFKFDKYNLSDTSTNVIFPGAIIKGDSLFTNDKTLISTKRTPISIMSNQENGKSIQISNPNFTEVTAAINNFAINNTENLSKEWHYNMKSVSSSQELNRALGIGVKGVGIHLGANTSENFSTVCIVYSQTYFSVNAEPLHNATDYFADGVDLQILGEDEPAYVSSVDYGRKIILQVSSTMSQTDLSAKLSACIKGTDISLGIQNVIKDESLTCSLSSYGGRDINGLLDTSTKNKGVIGDFKTWFWGDAEEESGLGERLNAFLSEPGELINPVPLSFNLKYLSDNSNVPAMYINKESITPADNAQFVSLSMTDSSFTIDTLTLQHAFLLNADNITLQDGKANGSYAEILWDSAYGIPITLTYKDKKYTIDLASYDMEKKIEIPIVTSSFSKSVTVEIYKANKPLNAMR